ncbi:hypothetical protein SDC9_97818 [bioreactor metagenome]|uniref:Uncharacterized protein n=1 Tax=bioreactor metagenome TaxID=1076179 RepID=A0A645ACZ0_9ZZZZ
MFFQNFLQIHRLTWSRVHHKHRPSRQSIQTGMPISRHVRPVAFYRNYVDVLCLSACRALLSPSYSLLIPHSVYNDDPPSDRLNKSHTHRELSFLSSSPQPLLQDMLVKHHDRLWQWLYDPFRKHVSPTPLPRVKHPYCSYWYGHVILPSSVERGPDAFSEEPAFHSRHPPKTSARSLQSDPLMLFH